MLLAWQAARRDEVIAPYGRKRRKKAPDRRFRRFGSGIGFTF